MITMLTALKDLKVLKHQIPAYGLTPNTSIQNKPLLIYKSAFPHEVTTDDIEKQLRSVGVVSPQWRFTMYQRNHFHVGAFTDCKTTANPGVANYSCRQHPMKSWVSHTAKPGFVSAMKTTLSASRRLSAKVMS